jgi:hypothetical protein
MNKEFDVPDVLYRGFGTLEHARAFVDKGFIRFGWLEGYRTIEDPRRRDQNEGKALLHTPIIPEHWEGRHKVYVLCCSVDPAYVASKFPYVVRINNPKTMIVDVREHVSSHPVVPNPQVDARRVRYDRGGTVQKPPDIDQWVDIAYSQKSHCFSTEREYRIAILSRLSREGPSADPVGAWAFVSVELNRRLDYCDLLGD